LQKEINYLLRQNALVHELNTNLTFREQETEVDTHIVPTLQEALAQSGIQATHTLIHDIVHQKFKYKKSKKILSADEKENLTRRQHANNRSHEVKYKFTDHCGKLTPMLMLNTCRNGRGEQKASPTSRELVTRRSDGTTVASGSTS
jgi:hypothetical protein